MILHQEKKTYTTTSKSFFLLFWCNKNAKKVPAHFKRYELNHIFDKSIHYQNSIFKEKSLGSRKLAHVTFCLTIFALRHELLRNVCIQKTYFVTTEKLSSMYFSKRVALIQIQFCIHCCTPPNRESRRKEDQSFIKSDLWWKDKTTKHVEPAQLK